jgi:hypothetical protein
LEEKGNKIMSVHQYSSGCHREKGEMEFQKGNAIRPDIILLIVERLGFRQNF